MGKEGDFEMPYGIRIQELATEALQAACTGISSRLTFEPTARGSLLDRAHIDGLSCFGGITVAVDLTVARSGGDRHGGKVWAAMEAAQQNPTSAGRGAGRTIVVEIPPALQEELATAQEERIPLGGIGRKLVGMLLENLKVQDPTTFQRVQQVLRISAVERR